MSYWIDKAKAHHDWAHPNDGYDLRLGTGRSLSEIEAVEEEIGFQFPADVRAFYQEVDGIGVEHNDLEKVSWFVVPLKNISATIQSSRDWFRETHPNEAERFFAFVDWDCGDYSGYLVLSGEGAASFVTFSHEEYEFDPDQSASDFFAPTYDHFEELLDTD